eukprot:m.136872 g.136872  ORF g.136872 m.136872 type:complete len:836 (+) comp14739_c0_seq4:950-3457(+)
MMRLSLLLLCFSVNINEACVEIGTDIDCDGAGLVNVPNDLNPQATSIIISFNAISKLPANTFRNFTALHTLMLDDNSVSILGADVFVDLPALNKLSVENNVISLISENAFKGLSSLTDLNIGGNLIDLLPAKIFHDLTSLVTLSLSVNNFVTIESQTFKGLSSVLTLNMEDVALIRLPIGLFADMTSLTTLALAYNAITSLPVGIFNTIISLNILDLSFNSITSIELGTLNSLANVTELLLTSNAITELGYDIFNGMDSLIDLLLDDNQIARIRNESFFQLPNETSISLQDNIVVCDVIDNVIDLCDCNSIHPNYTATLVFREVDGWFACEDSGWVPATTTTATTFTSTSSSTSSTSRSSETTASVTYTSATTMSITNTSSTSSTTTGSSTTLTTSSKTLTSVSSTTLSTLSITTQSITSGTKTSQTVTTSTVTTSSRTTRTQTSSTTTSSVIGEIGLGVVTLPPRSGLTTASASDSGSSKMEDSLLAIIMVATGLVVALFAALVFWRAYYGRQEAEIIANNPGLYGRRDTGAYGRRAGDDVYLEGQEMIAEEYANTEGATTNETNGQDTFAVKAKETVRKEGIEDREENTYEFHSQIKRRTSVEEALDKQDDSNKSAAPSNEMEMDIYNMASPGQQPPTETTEIHKNDIYSQASPEPIEASVQESSTNPFGEPSGGKASQEKTADPPQIQIPKPPPQGQNEPPQVTEANQGQIAETPQIQTSKPPLQGQNEPPQVQPIKTENEANADTKSTFQQKSIQTPSANPFGPPPEEVQSTALFDPFAPLPVNSPVNQTEQSTNADDFAAVQQALSMQNESTEEEQEENDDDHSDSDSDE